MSSLQSLCFLEAGLYSENDASKVATMLGVRLVGQILEEACTVVSATQRIGWPWSCVLSIFKDLKAGKVTAPERDALFEYLQGETTRMKPENLIGQGDEEVFRCRHERNRSLTMYINQLFDMSNDADAEIDDVEIVKTEMINQDNYKISDIMSEIMENIFQRVEIMTNETEEIIEIPSKEAIIFKDETVVLQIDDEDLKEEIRDIHLALMQEAYSACGLETVKCFLDEEDDDSMEDYVQVTNASVHVHRSGAGDECDAPDVPVITARTEEDEKSEAARYENAYLTLNRDYEQCSDDEDPVLQDAKEPMQEVKLFPSSDDSGSSISQEEEARKQLAATSGVSGVSGKSRASLVSRCKTQGARLLACLRGWWRRKTPGKRRGRTTGSIRGVCPLSPDARRRAASMLDQRELYSQPASRSAAWKFNTVNEGIIQSSRWQDYTYELAEKSSDEFC